MKMCSDILSVQIMFQEGAVSRERSLWKTVSFEEQLMFKDKYLSIFSCQMEAIVLINIQIF